ncbi:hypothetical protein AVEN_240042-1 [Araneus ventricosus]|uniref:DUF19 domain-containing protein n=1 Tax=Araneus ventricosus TaxID=182803 RepID=A0A4Y2SWZ3_ARAVE|nr:hypothetical protein AVEN_240042-1 [Araneus ventricosus]
MTFNMLLFALSVLLIAKVTLGEIDCETDLFVNCERPKVFNQIPREVSEFNDSCVETKSYLRCAKEYRDECGKDGRILFRSPGLFDDTYNTVSDVCEEGTLLNSVATENLKCFNETFGKTKCRQGAAEFVEPLERRIRENEELEYTFSFLCLRETHTTDCVLRALSDNCGKLVEEASLEFVRRSKSLEYACSVRGAQSVLDELENFDLSEDKKISMGLLLTNVVEENSD